MRMCDLSFLYIQFIKAVVSPTNYIRFKPNRGLLIDIDQGINLVARVMRDKSLVLYLVC